MYLLISPNSRKHSDCNRLIISVAFCYFLRQGPISSLGARIFPKIGLSALSRAGALAPIWRKTGIVAKVGKRLISSPSLFFGVMFIIIADGNNIAKLCYICNLMKNDVERV